jgi:hypothetical protein
MLARRSNWRRTDQRGTRRPSYAATLKSCQPIAEAGSSHDAKDIGQGGVIGTAMDRSPRWGVADWRIRAIIPE